MAAGIPYMQFYVADYLADTMHLTAEEHGAYLLLIMNYWQTGKPIPIKRIPAIVRMDSERIADALATLSEFFSVDDAAGVWRHERIDRELKKVKEKSETAQKAAKKRWIKHNRTSEGNADAYANVDANALPTECHTDTDTDTDTPLPPKGHDGGKPNDGLPEWLNRKSWQEWIRYKMEKGSPPSNTSRRKQLQFLEQHKDDHEAIIEQSIRNEWSMLKEIPKEHKPKSNDREVAGGWTT